MITALVIGLSGQKVITIDKLYTWVESDRYYLWKEFGDSELGRYAVYVENGIDKDVLIKSLCYSVIETIKGLK